MRVYFMLTVNYNRIDLVSNKTAGILSAYLLSQQTIPGPSLPPWQFDKKLSLAH